MKRGLFGLMIPLTIGCGVDLSLPTVTMRAPMAGSVMSSRIVRLAWDNANPGDAPLCVNLFARRTDETPTRRLSVAPRATQLLLRAADLPAVSTLFWNVSDCALPLPTARWQVTVPLAGEAREAVVSGVRSDLDGDGRSDLFYARGATPDRRVRMEHATLWRATVFSVGRSPSSPDRPVQFRAAGDIDGDGFADMLLLDGSLSVIYGGAYTELTAPVTLIPTLAVGAEVLAGRDLDGDGRAEVLTLTPHTLTTMTLDARGSLRTVREEALPFGNVTAVEARWISDHDGDGAPELLVNARDAVGGCHVRWSAGDTRWTRVGGASVALALQSVGDLDGDEREDIAWVSADGHLVACSGPRFDACEPMGERVRVAVSIDAPSGHQRIPVTLSDADGGGFTVATHTRCEAGRCAQTLLTLASDGSGVAPELLAVDDDGDGRGDLFARVTTDALLRITLESEREPETPTAPSTTRAPGGATPDVAPPTRTTPGGHPPRVLVASERLDSADPNAITASALMAKLGDASARSPAETIPDSLGPTTR